MATTYRAQVAIWTDSVAPRDACVVNPCFHDLGTSDADGLAQDILDEFQTVGPAGQIEVKLYDVTTPPPNPPLARKIEAVGTSPQAACPREVALCLSFYADSNVPRRRGRLFIPIHWIKAGTTAALGVRPSTGDRTTIGGIADKLANIGGVDVDWVVWSERSQQHHSVTNWYVDDEWDTVRSRGLRPTTRTIGTVDESGLTRQVPLMAFPGELVAEASNGSA